MKRLLTYQLVILLLVLSTQAFGVTVPLPETPIVIEPTPGGSGNNTTIPGTKPIPGYPVQINSMYNEYDVDGLHLYANIRNDSEGSSAHVDGWLEQGINGRYYKYLNGGTNYYKDNEYDPGRFSFHTTLNFEILDEENYTPDFDLNINQSSHSSLFGLDLDEWFRVRNRWDWFCDPTTCHSFLTDDIQFFSDMDLSPGYIDDMSINPWEWTMWIETPQGIIEQDILAVNFSASGYVPEPTTIALLGLGTLFLLRRKRH